jgi:hypothetical protein
MKFKAKVEAAAHERQLIPNHGHRHLTVEAYGGVLSQQLSPRSNKEQASSMQYEMTTRH